MKFVGVASSLIAAVAAASHKVGHGATSNSNTRRSNGVLSKNDIPDSGRDWVSLPNGVQFQPGPTDGKNKEENDRLEYLRKLAYDGFTSESSSDVQRNPQLSQIFVDGTETYYDEWAQAWRVLGWYIDCDACDEQDNHDNNGDGDQYESCWVFAEYNNYDENNKYENNQDQNKQNQYRGGCQRYLVWAAYIDLDYEGYKVHEYQYYDRKNEQWSDTSCKNVANLAFYQEDGPNNDDNGDWLNSLTPVYGKARCVKMDCHLPNTHYKLLGIFKEPHYDEWMEQLFKHEGDCVWDDHEYKFMQANREAWPNGCTQSQTHMTEDEGYIYYDLKPSEYGRMDIGLYTDDSCITEYTGSFTVQEVLEGAGYVAYNYTALEYNDKGERNNNQNNQNCPDGQQDGNRGCKHNILSLSEELEMWNDAFDVWKQCSPCKTSLLIDIVAGTGLGYNYTGNRESWDEARGNMNNRHDDGDDDDDDDDDYNFHCFDDAGYDNVNQCMKFRTKTKMLWAKIQDVEVAAKQNTITQIQLGDTVLGSARPHYWNLGSFHEYNSPIRNFGDAKAWIFPITTLVLSVMFASYGLGKYLRASNASVTTRQRRQPLMGEIELA